MMPQFHTFPMPRLDDFIYTLSGSVIFQIDLNSGYLEIHMEESDIAKTAFVLPFGHYKFLRMPFDLCSAQVTFQKAKSELASHLPFTKVYLDVLLIQ